MKKVHTLVRYLGICDGNMQKFLPLRCHVRCAGGRTTVRHSRELKNLNSFRFSRNHQPRGSAPIELI